MIYHGKEPVTTTNINSRVDTVVPQHAPVYFLEECEGLQELLLRRARARGV
jgi:hypothetical protein